MAKKPNKEITTTEALKIVRKQPNMEKTTRVSIITWCKKYDLGKKYIGRWRIDASKLKFFLEKGGV